MTVIYFCEADLAVPQEVQRKNSQLGIEELLRSPKKYLLSHYRPSKYSALSCREIVPALAFYFCIHYYKARIGGYN